MHHTPPNFSPHTHPTRNSPSCPVGPVGRRPVPGLTARRPPLLLCLLSPCLSSPGLGLLQIEFVLPEDGWLAGPGWGLGQTLQGRQCVGDLGDFAGAFVGAEAVDPLASLVLGYEDLADGSVFLAHFFALFKTVRRRAGTPADRWW